MDSADRARRCVLRGAFGLVGLVAVGAPAWAAPRKGVRRISLYNVHTDERERVTYWENGAYVEAAMRRIEHLLRDHRSGEVHPIDPRLIDLLSALTRRLETTETVEVVSAYRSAASNAQLARSMRGVGKHSLHVQGMAVDIALQHRDLERVRDAALALRQGGVGYYPRHGFLHLDVGPVRNWQRPA